MKCNHLPDSPDTELISLLSIFKVTLPLEKIQSSPAGTGRGISGKSGAEKVLTKMQISIITSCYLTRIFTLQSKHSIYRIDRLFDDHVTGFRNNDTTCRGAAVSGRTGAPAGQIASCFAQPILTKSSVFPTEH